MARCVGTPKESKTWSPPLMAKSALRVRAFLKAMSVPMAALSSGWMWVSVRKMKVKGSTGGAAKTEGVTAAEMPAAPRRVRNWRRVVTL
ncbi:MAG TPA: hypothetical protein VNY78_04625 [Edaphobacter sp.]|nr:hypothetical protein [Edaphobacter sp.]